MRTKFGGGTEPIELEYISGTWSAGAGITFQTRKKAKAIILRISTTVALFNCDEEKIYSDNTYFSTCTVTNNSVSTASSFSSVAQAYKGYIIY